MRNIRKLYKNKKGLSPVISTILMILVVMVGMSLLFTYVAVYAQNYKAGIGSSVMESLTIEDVFLKSTGSPPQYTNEAVISVYNSGQIDAKINVIYVNGVTASKGLNYNLPVPVGQHRQITVQAPAAWTSGNPYKFTISTVRGSIFEESIVAP